MKNLAKKFRTLKNLLRKRDFAGLNWKFQKRIIEKRRQKDYEKWLGKQPLIRENKGEFIEQIRNFSRQPLISVIMPVYNVEEKWLSKAIESVIAQVYENWELCIADDCSPAPHVRKILEEYVLKNNRIKVVFRPENGHISAASNSALELANGEFCALLDHDDELSPDALFYVAAEINRFPAAKMIYTDEDIIDEKGVRRKPQFKPDFSRDFLYSVNYVTHLAVYKTEILRKIGGWRKGFEGSQDYDLALRVTEQIDEKEIRHIPKILYHWRAIRGSVAFSADEKPYAHERARKAVSEHLQRLDKKAQVAATTHNLHRVCYEMPGKLPKTALILIANDDLKFTVRAVENFIEQTDYADFEIVLIADFEEEIAKLKSSRVKLYEKRGGAAKKYNFAAAQTNAEILCFADLNLKPLTKDWLKELASFAVQKEIGAVGAKILDKHQKILHGGLIVGTAEIVSAAHRNLPSPADGNIFRAQIVNNFSAVSAACLAARRDIFQEAGGFDEKNLPETFFDADFCLKLRRKNYRIVFTPYAELIKINRRQLLFERKHSETEKKFFIQKWGDFIENDEFYNLNLSKRNGDFLIES